ncbi:MAG TPA: DNA-directed RNA polymerase subunit omega [Miltoncostaeaceae bacterium]|nr:DNA-directed RNA polymerase subunit omega [Miltoncostaeaceae bacterium]
MLYGRRLDEALEHVDGSRYALVHAVAKRARQITLWLTADPAELRAESAPPPSAAGEIATRDPVALAEAEILAGEVTVHWDPDGRADERELLEAALMETDPLLLEGLGDEEEDDDGDGEEEAEATVTPALAQALEAEAPAAAAEGADGDEAGDDDVGDDVEDVDELEDELIGEGEDEEMGDVPLEDLDEDAGEDGEDGEEE